MDSVEGCCGLRKTDGFQNAQAGSSPKKVDLIIWEIEVPKVKASSSASRKFPGPGVIRLWGQAQGKAGKPEEGPE